MDTVSYSFFCNLDFYEAVRLKAFIKEAIRYPVSNVQVYSKVCY